MHLQSLPACSEGGTDRARGRKDVPRSGTGSSSGWAVGCGLPFCSAAKFPVCRWAVPVSPVSRGGAGADSVMPGVASAGMAVRAEAFPVAGWGASWPGDCNGSFLALGCICWGYGLFCPA